MWCSLEGCGVANRHPPMSPVARSRNGAPLTHERGCGKGVQERG